MTPDKIYIADNVFPSHIDWDGSPINTKRIESSDIEYIRKDALLEWAKEKEQNAITNLVKLTYRTVIDKIETL